jgi:hypothetical protein
MLYVELLNKRCNAGGRTFCDAIKKDKKSHRKIAVAFLNSTTNNLNEHCPAQPVIQAVV